MVVKKSWLINKDNKLISKFNDVFENKVTYWYKSSVEFSHKKIINNEKRVLHINSFEIRIVVVVRYNEDKENIRNKNKINKNVVKLKRK